MSTLSPRLSNQARPVTRQAIEAGPDVPAPSFPLDAEPAAESLLDARTVHATVAGDDLRPLRCFLAVADELNFTRAARTLGLSQPQLSRAVRRLEDELGVELLHRTSREVTLTEAGRCLRDEAADKIAGLDRAYSLARRKVAKPGGHVILGWTSGGAGVHTSEILRRFDRDYPTVGVELRQSPWSEQIAALNEGRVDLQFLRTPTLDLPGVRLEPLFREPRVVALAADHPLASRKAVSLADIRSDALISIASVPKAWTDWWLVDPRPDGGSPRYGVAVDTIEEMLEHVAAGHGIGITNGSTAYGFRRPDVVYLRILDAEPSLVSIAWRPDRETSAMHSFVRVTREVFRTRWLAPARTSGPVGSCAVTDFELRLTATSP